MPPLSGQWRGLSRLSRDPAFVARASAEFPQLAVALGVPHDRRGVLKLMAAGLALAGLGGCDDGAPDGVLIPPVLPSTDTVSAGSHLFATASVVGGYANGILVRHVNGRPIKVEGNPSHPASLGGTSAMLGNLLQNSSGTYGLMTVAQRFGGLRSSGDIERMIGQRGMAALNANPDSLIASLMVG